MQYAAQLVLYKGTQTFDQHNYDFMGLCECVLSKPCNSNDFIIVGKNAEVNDRIPISTTKQWEWSFLKNLEINFTRGGCTTAK